MRTMIRLDKALRELIYEHNCVTVPSFGSFILRESIASANKFTGDIKPSGQTIFFNNAIVADDGILANYYKENLGISYSKALKYIQDDTDQIVSGLKERRSFPFGHVGNFFLNGEGKVFFLPSGALNISKKTFGLNVFKVEELTFGNGHEILFLPQPEFPKRRMEAGATEVDTLSETQDEVVVEELVPIVREEKVDVEFPVIEIEEEAIEEETKSENLDPTKETELTHAEVTKEQEPELAEEEGQSVKTKNIILRAAASIILILLAGGFYVTAHILLPKYAEISQKADLKAAAKEKKDARLPEMATTNIIVSKDPHIGRGDDVHFMAAVIRNSENYLNELSQKPGDFYIIGGTYLGENIALNECWRWKKLGIDATFAKVVDSSMKKVLLGRFVREKDAQVFAGQLPKLDGKELRIQQLKVIYK